MDHALHHKLEATSADAMFHLTIWIRFFVNWSKEALSWRVTARACCWLNTRCIYVVQVQVSWGKRKMMNTFLVSDSLVVYSGKKHPGHILTHGSLLKFSHNLRMTEVRWLVVSRETKFGLVNTGTPWWGRAGARRCDPGESHIPTHPGSSHIVAQALVMEEDE